MKKKARTDTAIPDDVFLVSSPSEGTGLLRYGQGDPAGTIARLVAADSLYIVSQPIVDLTHGEIYAHEALIRGPQDSALHSPDALLKTAKAEDYLLDFEIACVIKALAHWSGHDQAGRIFINVSATALTNAFRGHRVDEISRTIEKFGISPRSVVFEITEHEHISNVPDFISTANALHAAGMRFALDDFGDGRSSLRLWSELSPDVVKIDKYFTKDINSSARKIRTIRALMQMADNFSCALVAEGIETADDLLTLRDLGVQFGQGYFLGRPDRAPLAHINEQSSAVLRASRVSILPTQSTVSKKINLRDSMIVMATPVTAQTTTAEALQLFVDNPGWHALAVLSGVYPVAIIGRSELLTQSAKPYFSELFGKKSCMRHANTSPRTVEIDQDVQDLIGILTSQDQRYLSEGFIFTENGQYKGVGLGEHLVRLVTESRIEAARHANPLTFLPGNIPISEHINRLLERGSQFSVAYVDLANFKPFNDYYGYWQGDEVIKMVAATLMRYLDRKLDFVGHVGGDDFLLVFQSENWHERLSRAITEFNHSVIRLYDAPAVEAGGIYAEDRLGIRRFFTFTTLYAGVVHQSDGPFANASHVSSAAAKARHEAKRNNVDIYVNQMPASMMEEFAGISPL